MVVAAYGGKREGMVVRPNYPIEKVRQLQRRLYREAKCQWDAVSTGIGPALAE